MNGRGLTCSPACDAITSVFPDATDYFAVFTVLDGGTHSPGDTLVVTATQDAVTLDSATVTVVGQAHDMTLTMASGKTTVTAGAPSCAIGDSPSDPTRALGRASFTDINGTPLVGYHPTFTTSASSVMHVGNVSGSGAASWEVTSMLQADGQTAGEDVVCGVSAGPATLSAVTRSDEIQGVSGTVTRTQVITVNSPPSVGGIAEAPVIGDVAEPHHGASPAWWIALAVIGVAGAGGAWLWRRRLSR